MWMLLSLGRSACAPSPTGISVTRWRCANSMANRKRPSGNTKTPSKKTRLPRSLICKRPRSSKKRRKTSSLLAATEFSRLDGIKARKLQANTSWTLKMKRKVKREIEKNVRSIAQENQKTILKPDWVAAGAGLHLNLKVAECFY